MQRHKPELDSNLCPHWGTIFLTNLSGWFILLELKLTLKVLQLLLNTYTGQNTWGKKKDKFPRTKNPSLQESTGQAGSIMHLMLFYKAWNTQLTETFYSHHTMRCPEAPSTMAEPVFSIPYCEAGAQSKDLPQGAKSCVSSLQPAILALLPSTAEVTWASTPVSHRKNWLKCQLHTAERSQSFDF